MFTIEFHNSKKQRLKFFIFTIYLKKIDPNSLRLHLNVNWNIIILLFMT